MLTEEPVFEGVETFCCQRRRDVTLDLSLSRRPLGSVVSGVPVSCSCEAGCLKGVQCLLGKRITAGRKAKSLIFISSSKDCTCSVRKEKLAAEQT